MSIPDPVILYGGLPVRLSTALEHTRMVGESIPDWHRGGQQAVDAFIMARGMPEHDQTDREPIDMDALLLIIDGEEKANE